MFGPSAFDCEIKLQLAGTDTFSFVIWVYSFNSFFSVPEVGRVSPFSIYIGYHDNIDFISYETKRGYI